jgi:hypothetical protein
MKVERHVHADGSEETPPTFKHFAENHNLTLEIHKRLTGDPKTRVWVRFKNSEIKDGSLLHSTTGRGPTEHAAILDYCIAIAGKLLVIDAYGTREGRVELQVPAGLYHPAEDIGRPLEAAGPWRP